MFHTRRECEAAMKRMVGSALVDHQLVFLRPCVKVRSQTGNGAAWVGSFQAVELTPREHFSI